MGNLARASLSVMQVGEPLASDGPIMEVTARIRIMRAAIANHFDLYRDEHRQLGDIHRDPPRLIFGEQPCGLSGDQVSLRNRRSSAPGVVTLLKK